MSWLNKRAHVIRVLQSPYHDLQGLHVQASVYLSASSQAAKLCHTGAFNVAGENRIHFYLRAFVPAVPPPPPPQCCDPSHLHCWLLPLLKCHLLRDMFPGHPILNSSALFFLNFNTLFPFKHHNWDNF